MKGDIGNWDEYISMVQYSLNLRIATIHKLDGGVNLTKKSAERAVLLTEIVFPGIMEAADNHRKKEQRSFDQSHKIVEFPIGTKVAMVNQHRGSKLEQAYISPLTVKRKKIVEIADVDEDEVLYISDNRINNTEGYDIIIENTQNDQWEVYTNGSLNENKNEMAWGGMFTRGNATAESLGITTAIAITPSETRLKIYSDFRAAIELLKAAHNPKTTKTIQKSPINYL
ncbi:hypothetical protein BB559_002762 [Furculomyces boomerangus]|uniref:RNase H type-1 domain-containing protein n=1 Tax=Furculomyces boomerangus TaxID=61424 RepID=A0A2T9YSX6_9FUNG|nr:hypothetical protein BB559_002762 [Furculomyces boomerangus]